MRSVLIGSLIVLAFAACGGGDDDDDTGTVTADAAVGGPDADPATLPDAGTPGDPDASPVACAAFGHTASIINSVRVAQNLPAPTGGAIADGTYHQTENTLYTGPGGDTTPPDLRISATWKVEGNAHGFIVSVNEAPTMHREYIATTAGATIDFSVQCEEPAGGTLTFDAYTVHSPTSFSLFSTGANVESVFVKQ